MTSNHEFDRLIRAWLEEGTTQLPDRVLDDVLDQLPQVRQRKRRHAPWRWLLPPQPRAMLFAVAGAAAAAAIVLGIGLVAPSVGDPPEAPTVLPSAAPSDVPDLPGTGNLVGGTYRLWVRAQLSVTLEVPEGWDSYERWAITIPGASPGSTGLAFWNPVNLYSDPRSASREPMEPPVGPTVDDLAQALATHTGWQAEPPRPINVDGHDGLLVRITIPSEPKITVCEEFALWYDVAEHRSQCVREPGALLDVYILDVGGERVVFDALYDPGAHPDQVAGLRDAVESVRFDPAP